MTSREPTEVTVLIVEDDYLIAETLSGFVRGMGHEVVGPAGSVKDALRLLNGPVTIALVDMNLGGESISPLVSALRSQGIPFAFVSAYPNAGTVRPGLEDIPFFRKPVSRATLVEAVTLLLSRARLQYTLDFK